MIVKKDYAFTNALISNVKKNNIFNRFDISHNFIQEIESNHFYIFMHILNEKITIIEEKYYFKNELLFKSDGENFTHESCFYLKIIYLNSNLII